MRHRTDSALIALLELLKQSSKNGHTIQTRA